MLHAVFPVLDKIGVHELVFLGVDRVAELSCIAHRDLLIPFLVAHLMFAAEGIEARDADVQVGQRHGDTRVTHVLREVGRGTQRQSDTGEGSAPTDRRGTCGLCERLRIVHTRQVVTLILR